MVAVLEVVDGGGGEENVGQGEDGAGDPDAHDDVDGGHAVVHSQSLAQWMHYGQITAPNRVSTDRRTGRPEIWTEPEREENNNNKKKMMMIKMSPHN